MYQNGLEFRPAWAILDENNELIAVVLAKRPTADLMAKSVGGQVREGALEFRASWSPPQSGDA